jgi:cysteine desulfurase family protein
LFILKPQVFSAQQMKLIYLDNPATSWPKPPCVAQAMNRFMTDVGANPGRSGHRLSIDAARTVYAAREAVAELFGVADPLRIVFGPNATWALNLALQGLLKPGDHVVTSSVEHNSVMRPLRHLESTGVKLTVVPCAVDASLTPSDVEKALTPATRLVVLTHASNVTGTLLPVREVGAICRSRGVLLLVDAAQTAGSYPIDMSADLIDLLAFTGHKSMQGPMGTGGLVIGERVDPASLLPLERGGTGSHSDEQTQPDFLPDKYESGTPNAVGLAGLGAGVRWVLERGVSALREHEMALTARLLSGLQSVKGVTVQGPTRAEQRVATVSFTMGRLSPSDVGQRLDEEHGVMCRVGLHCSPACHRTIGTFPEGTVRFGLGPFTTEADIDHALKAMESIARGAR